MLKALLDSLSPNDAVRNAATKTILDGAKAKGFVKEMLEVCVAKDIEPSVNLQAAIQLRNHIERHWKYMNLKEAKELLGEDFKKSDVYIYEKEEREYM